MSIEKRPLRPRHYFPEVFAPYVQFKRGLLRVMWLVLGEVPAPSLWATSVTAGMVSVMLTITLYLWNPVTSAARVIERPSERQVQAAPPTIDRSPPKPQPEPDRLMVPRNSLAPSSSQARRSSIPRDPNAGNIVPAMSLIPARTPRPEFDFKKTWRVQPLPWDFREVTQATSRPAATRLDEQEFFNPFATAGDWLAFASERHPPQQPVMPYHRNAPWFDAINASRAMAADSIDGYTIVSTGKGAAVVIEKHVTGRSVAGQPLNYTLIVTNVGDSAIDQLVLRESVSQIESVTSVDPPAAIDRNALVWDFADFAPQQTQRLTVSLIPRGEHPLQTRTTAEVTTRIAAKTLVSEPERRSSLRIETLPQNARIVGETDVILFRIFNTSDQVAEDVELNVEISNELQHRAGSELQMSVGTIKPHKDYEVRLITKAVKPGQAMLRSTVTASNADEISLAKSIDIRPLKTIRSEPEVTAVDEKVEQQPVSEHLEPTPKKPTVTQTKVAPRSDAPATQSPVPDEPASHVVIGPATACPPPQRCPPESLSVWD